HREIGKELICFGRKQRSHHKPYQGTSQCAAKQNDFGIEVSSTPNFSQVGEAPPKEQEIQNQSWNPNFDSDLQIAHVYFFPDAGIVRKVANANSEQWVVHNSVDRLNHQEAPFLE